MARDPVCGMEVDEARAAATHAHGGRTYHFCALSCRDRFRAAPDRYLTAAGPARVPEAAVHGPASPVPVTGLPAAGPAPRPAAPSAGTRHTCPMHPEVVRDGPGICPICGMALEPVVAAPDEEENPELRDMRRRFVLGAALTLPLLAVAMGGMIPGAEFPPAGWHGLLPWLQAALASPVVLYCGWPFFARARASLHLRSPNMFTLIGLGTASAYLFSLAAVLAPGIFPISFRDPHHGGVPLYFESAAVIVVLVLLGQVLELRARGRTGGAIRALLALQPKSARRIGADGSEAEVPIEEIQAGDLIRVRPGEKVPVDGVVVEGRTSVDESLVTGESVPVSKGPGARLIGSTINGRGAVVMRAERVGAGTLLQRIVRLVGEAQRSRAPIQRLADAVSSWFVPAVVAVAALAFALWATLGPEPRLAHALVAAVSVLIIACPCALGLATPMSIMVGVGRGALAGVLVRHAGALERLAAVDVLVIDKTGTLTEGRPRLATVAPAPGVPPDDLLRLAASLERGSEHPLADAVLAGAAERGVATAGVGHYQALPGRGAIGTVEGRAVALGNEALMRQVGIDVRDSLERAEALRRDGQTVIFAGADGRPAGLLGVVDPVRESAAEAIAALKAGGLEILVLSGDHRLTVEAVARRLGLDAVEAGVTPERKAEVVARLQGEGRVVAAAGDGINDAPALARADVGIAMGTGTDVAIESGGITLVRSDLRGLVRARRLSRAVLRNIRQNLFFAFAYNALCVPVAAGLLYPLTGLVLSPMIAAAAMTFSSVTVIANALRLRRAPL